MERDEDGFFGLAVGEIHDQGLALVAEGDEADVVAVDVGVFDFDEHGVGWLVAYFMDLLPWHFHLRRLRLLGLLGSLFQSPLILADRAQ